MDRVLAALSLHIAFLLVWSAALVYMPVLLFRQAGERDPGARERIALMERWLYATIMTPAALLAVLAGTWLVFERGFQGGWLPAKLALVVLLAWFHVHCGHLMVGLKQRGPLHRGYYGVLPAVPALLITGIFWLVTGKPF